jgi:hypothetical protein
MKSEIVILIIVYIILVLLARYINYKLIKIGEENESYANVWFIPFLNFLFVTVMGGRLIYYYYERSNNKLIKKFFLKNLEEIDYNERILSNMDIKIIEKHLRKRKLKKLN